MRIHKRFLIGMMAVALLGGPVVLRAQEADSLLQLSLEDAQRHALEHNRSLKNATLEVQVAEARRWQTLATMLPQVSAKADYSNMFGYSMDLGQFKISMPNSITFNGTASVALSGAQVVGVQLEKIAGRMADISLKQTEQEVSDQVKTLYYSALAMEETVDLLEQNLVNLEKLQQHTLRSVEVGVAEQTDADRISVQVTSMKTSLNSTRRQLEMIYNSMRLQLGLSVATELALTQNVDDLMQVENALALLDTEFVLDNNYNFQLLSENVALAQKQIALKKWEFAPTLSAFYQYTKVEYMSDEMTMRSTPPNMFGLSLNVPIFSSGSRLKGVKMAQLAYQQQVNTYDDTREALLVQHRQLMYNLSSSFESYLSQKENMTVAQRLFDNVSRKYEHGMASSMDVTNTGTELVAAQSSYVQALLEVVTARIELEQLLNTDNQ
ncbi:TolC family protein [Geofilum rhodophaeum]|uniref:TolC family protein n=1 Tax=Geofilum rhodophaeum TaxID=1965019 RepID=UPI001F0B41CE|nr:TolC family protein [Geofilum rhodophaeum]